MTQYVLAASEWLNFRGILDYFRDLKRSWDRRADVNATIKQLSALSDRELNDMGISRCDIRQVANGFDPRETNENLKGWV